MLPVKTITPQLFSRHGNVQESVRKKPVRIAELSHHQPAELSRHQPNVRQADKGKCVTDSVLELLGQPAAAVGFTSQRLEGP
jgi:hypothetical protein